LYHPDKNPNCKLKAEIFFKAVGEAHEVLDDSNKRIIYNADHSLASKPEPIRYPSYSRPKHDFNSASSSSAYAPKPQAAKPAAQPKKDDPKPHSHFSRSTRPDFFPSFNYSGSTKPKSSFAQDNPKDTLVGLWPESEWRRFSGLHKSMTLNLQKILDSKGLADSLADRQKRALRIFNVLHFVLHPNQCITFDDTEKLHPTIFEILSKANEQDVIEWAKVFKKQDNENTFLKLALKTPRLWWYKYPGVIIVLAQGAEIGTLTELCDSEMKLFNDKRFRSLFRKNIIKIHDFYTISKSQLELLYEFEDKLSPIKSSDLKELLKLPVSQLKYILRSGILLKLLHEEHMNILGLSHVVVSGINFRHPSAAMYSFIDLGNKLFADGVVPQDKIEKLLLEFLTKKIIEEKYLASYYFFRNQWLLLPCMSLLSAAEKEFYEKNIFIKYFKLDSSANFTINLECNLSVLLANDTVLMKQTGMRHLLNRFLNDLVRALLNDIKQLDPDQDFDRDRLTIITSSLTALKTNSVSRNNLLELITYAENSAGLESVPDKECSLYYQLASLRPLADCLPESAKSYSFNK